MHDTTNSNQNNQNQQNSFATIAYTILGFVMLVAVGMPVLQTQYFYPKFIKLIIENTENEAIRTGRHMMRELLVRNSGNILVVSDDVQTYLDQMSTDYDLWKVKLFSESGKTVYSTEPEDVGNQNTNLYFQDVVSKGSVYTKVVQKNTKSLEGQVVSSDVVETYIPIMENGKFLGAFELYYNISIRKAAMDAIISQTNLLLYSLSGIMIVVTLGAIISLIRGMRQRKLYAERLYTLATKDTLTGAYTRSRFTELLQWEIEKYERYGKNSCLLMFDIDHFKKVNDTYGHQAGDEVLTAITEICKHSLRKSDQIGRYGGEEFVVFLPDIQSQNAVKVAEKLRDVVAGLTTTSGTKKIQVTISIGLVELREVQPLTVDTIIKLADDCLYTAKRNGRNMVCTSKELRPGSTPTSVETPSPL